MATFRSTFMHCFRPFTAAPPAAPPLASFFKHWCVALALRCEAQEFRTIAGNPLDFSGGLVFKSLKEQWFKKHKRCPLFEYGGTGMRTPPWMQAGPLRGRGHGDGHWCGRAHEKGGRTSNRAFQWTERDGQAGWERARHEGRHQQQQRCFPCFDFSRIKLAWTRSNEANTARAHEESRQYLRRLMGVYTVKFSAHTKQQQLMAFFHRRIVSLLLRMPHVSRADRVRLHRNIHRLRVQRARLYHDSANWHTWHAHRKAETSSNQGLAWYLAHALPGKHAHCKGCHNAPLVGAAWQPADSAQSAGQNAAKSMDKCGYRWFGSHWEAWNWTPFQCSSAKQSSGDSSGFTGHQDAPEAPQLSPQLSSPHFDSSASHPDSTSYSAFATLGAYPAQAHSPSSDIPVRCRRRASLQNDKSSCFLSNLASKSVAPHKLGPSPWNAFAPGRSTPLPCNIAALSISQAGHLRLQASCSGPLLSILRVLLTDLRLYLPSLPNVSATLRRGRPLASSETLHAIFRTLVSLVPVLSWTSRFPHLDLGPIGFTFLSSMVLVLATTVVGASWAVSEEEVPFTGRTRRVGLTQSEVEQLEARLLPPASFTTTESEWSTLATEERREHWARVLANMSGGGSVTADGKTILGCPILQSGDWRVWWCEGVLEMMLAGLAQDSNAARYDVIVIERDERNAFSFGFAPKKAHHAGVDASRGIIVVYSGMLDAIMSAFPPASPYATSISLSSDSSAQDCTDPPQPALPDTGQTHSLALLLSHELAHLVLSHPLESLSQHRNQDLYRHVLKDAILSIAWPFLYVLGPTGLSVLEGWIDAKVGSLVGPTKNGLEVGQWWMRTEEMEREADEVGLRLMELAGFDPSLALTNWWRDERFSRTSSHIFTPSPSVSSASSPSLPPASPHELYLDSAVLDAPF